MLKEKESKLVLAKKCANLEAKVHPQGRTLNKQNEQQKRGEDNVQKDW
jgi:hypothetical protein